MRILVLNGSPKGDLSVTMQYVAYLQKHNPQVEFVVAHISQRIKRLDENRGALEAVLEGVRAADGVLWATPVYYFLVPAQYKRFVELICEPAARDAFSGKYAAALTTSIHFFDYMAHNYLHAICDDLGMRYAGGYSAGMKDLLQPEGRANLSAFGDEYLRAIEERRATTRAYPPLVPADFAYEPAAADRLADLAGRKALILTDAWPDDRNLLRMVDRVRASLNPKPPVLNLWDVDIKGGCQGCLHCSFDNACVYAGKDGYVDFFNEHIRPAEVLILAGRLHDRFLSARWKLFFDRSFFNGHVPYLTRKHVAWLISGPLAQNAGLREYLSVYSELEHATLAGIVTDEAADSTLIDRLLSDLAARLVRNAERGGAWPKTFYSVAGEKLFRDFIWGSGRAVFQADHRTYQQLGAYDFPQRDIKQRFGTALMATMLKAPRVREVVQREMKQRIVAPFRKVLETA